MLLPLSAGNVCDECEQILLSMFFLYLRLGVAVSGSGPGFARHASRRRSYAFRLPAAVSSLAGIHTRFWPVGTHWDSGGARVLKVTHTASTDCLDWCAKAAVRNGISEVAYLVRPLLQAEPPNLRLQLLRERTHRCGTYYRGLHRGRAVICKANYSCPAAPKKQRRPSTPRSSSSAAANASD